MKKSLALFAAALALGLPARSLATQNVHGALTGDTVWSASYSPYLMTGDVTVPAGMTLTIEPGVTIQTNTGDDMGQHDTTHTELWVIGTIKVGVYAATGTGDSTKPVNFVGYASTRGGWGGIVFDAASTGGHIFQNAVVSYATYGVTTYSNAPLTIKDSLVHDCLYDGLYAKGVSSSLTFLGSVPVYPGPATAKVYNNGSSSSYHGLHNEGALTVTQAEVYGNSGAGVYSTGNSQTTGCSLHGNYYGVWWSGALANGNQSLSRSVLYSNSSQGLDLTLSAAGVTDLVEHNTFDHDGSYEIYNSQSAGTLTIRDNVLSNGGYGIFRASGGGTFGLNNNDVYNMTSGGYYGTSAGPGSITCNPLYVNRATANYRLTSNSPARNADSIGNDMGALVYLSDQTPTLEGILRQDLTLTAAGSPWNMLGDLWVPEGITLTIEPGATVVVSTTDDMQCGYVNTRAELIVQGSLQVAATPAKRAVIKTAAGVAGGWEGVHFESTSMGDTVSGLDVGYGNSCLFVEAPGLLFTDTRAHDCTSYDVQVGSAPASLAMTGDPGTCSGDFSLPSAAYNTQSQPAIYSAGGDLSVSNTEVYGGHVANISFAGQATLVGNRIHDSVSGGYGVYATLSGSSASVVQDCLIYASSNTGVYVQATSNTASLTLDHNTIDSNGSYGIDFYNYSYSPTLTVRNNLITNNGSYGIYRYSNSGTFAPDYNDVWNQTTNYYNVTAGTHSNSANPLYNYPVSGGRDYRLQPNSPARGSDDATPVPGDQGALPYYAIPVASIVVSPANPTIKAAGAQVFSAQGTESCTGFPVGGLTYAWQVLSNIGALNASGTFTAGCGLGSFPGVIQASVGSVSGTTGVTIVAGDAASVTVSPTSATLGLNQNQTFTATAEDTCSNPAAGTVAWSVVNPTAGVIDATGTFTASVTAGSYPSVIKATINGAVGYASVTVTPNGAGSITVSPNPGSIATNAQGQFFATGKDGQGNTFPISPVWSLSGCALGSIDPVSGIFTAGATAGSCSNGVVATLGSVVGYATVKVTNNPLSSIAVLPNPGSVAVNGTLLFTATGKDSTGGFVAIDPTWSVSGGGAIDPNTGLFTASCTTGPFTVTAKQGTISGTATVNVVAGQVTKVVVSPSSPSVVVSSGQQFTATGQDACGNAVAITPVWAVMDAGGSINAASGLFTAGTVVGTYPNTVRATANNVSGFATVVVTTGPLATVTVTPNPASLSINGAQQFSAAGFDQYGNLLSITPTWSVINGGGSVNGSGLFTAGGTAGTFMNTVKALSNGVSGQATVIVKPGPLASIVVSPANPSVAVNGFQQFTAVGKDAGGNPVAITPVWSASAGGTISAGGLFNAGTVANTFTGAIQATDNASGLSGTGSVTVTPGALATLAVNPPSATVGLGGTVTFTANGKDQYGNAIAAVTATWSVVNGGGSINSATGVFTAGNTMGTYANTVQATSGAITATATVIVSAGALAKIILTPSPGSVQVAGKLPFTATGQDASGNALTVTPTWSVVNGGGAIDQTGLFTAGTIANTFANTVKAVSGTISATATVTVTPGALASVTVSPATATLSPAGTQQFTAAGADGYANPITLTPTWSVVAGGGTITAAGLFTAGATAGSYPNTVKALDSTSGLSGTASVVINPGALAAITLAPATVELAVDGTQLFTATGKDAGGNTVSITPTWSVVAGGGSIDTSGNFTAGHLPGSFANTVKATSGTVSATASVTVDPGPLKTVNVTPSTATVAVNATQQFSATGVDQYGNATPGFSPTWTVVAGGGVVDASGKFTAGTATGSFPNTVQAQSGSVSGTASVTVTGGPAVSLTVSPDPANVPALSTAQFTVSAIDQYGNPTSVTPTWSVVNGGGSISASGLFTAGSTIGAYANTVKAVSGALSDTATVNVVQGTLAKIVLTPSPASLAVGATVQFTASGQDAAGNPIAFAPTWSVVAGGGAIDQTGLFTAGTATGTFTNTVKATSGSISATATVTVTAGALASLTVAPGSASLAPGATQQFTASGKDQYNNSVSITPTWSMVDATAGTIDAASGLLTAATASGTHPGAVKASAGALSATASVTINPGPATRLAITPPNATLAPHATVQFSAQGKDAWGNDVALTSTWSVVSGGGTISAGALFTAAGTTGTFVNTVKATSGALSATATVTVATSGLASISVVPAPASVAAQGTVQFSAAGIDVNGNPMAITPVWSASGGGTIDQSGLLTAGCALGLFAGAVTATVGGVQGQTDLTVLPGAFASLVVTPADPTVAAGGTQQFLASGADACGNPLPATPTWTMDDPTAGTIDVNGLFTATSTPGSYAGAISASAGGKTATASVKVVSGSIARVVLSPATASLAPQKTATFVATALDGSGKTVATTFTWSVVNQGGTVDASGVFTAGTAAGTFTDTVQATASTGVTGFASVTVRAGAAATIVVSPASAKLPVLGSETFSAVAKDAFGNIVAAPIAWSVTAGGGAIDQDGQFTAGTVAGNFANTVQAKSGSATGTASVEVDPGAVASLSIVPQTASLAPTAQTSFHADAKDAFGNAMASAPAWSIVAGGGTIDQTGLFTAGTAAGTFSNTVRGDINGLDAFASVTVTPGSLTTLTVAPTTVTLGARGTQQFTAGGVDQWSNPVTVSASWSVATATAGTITAGGLLTAGATAGSYPAAVVAQASGLTATADLTIVAGPLAQIEVAPPDVTLRPGDKQMFTATGQDADGNPIANATVTWSLASSMAGFITFQGLFNASNVTGRYPNVIVATSGSVTGTASVSINSQVVRVQILPQNPTVAMGEQVDFSAKAYDLNNNEVPDVPAVWTLANGGGTLSTTGEFTAGMQPGEFDSTIKATIAGVSATTSVTVGTPQPRDAGPAADSGSQARPDASQAQAGEDAGASSACDPACPAGQTCNEATGQCEAAHVNSGCGCGSTASAPLAGGALLTLLWAFGRRRRTPAR